jgi:hypothetical protein
MPSTYYDTMDMWPNHYEARDGSLIRWDFRDCPRAVPIVRQESPEDPPRGPPSDGLVAHWIVQTSEDPEKNHWVECKWVYDPEGEWLYRRDPDILTCKEVEDPYARAKLAEVGADLPERRKVPKPTPVSRNEARDAWMTDQRMAGKRWKQIRPELVNLISKQDKNQKWKLPKSRQDFQNAVTRYAERNGMTLPPLRRKPAKSLGVVNKPPLTAS